MKVKTTLQPWYLATFLPFYLFTILPFTVASQSRGTKPGEVYFSTTWYYSGTEQYDMIIRTTDHGKTFKPIYIYNHNSNNMPVGQVYADAKEGVIYNQNSLGLNISYDYGVNWTIVDTIISISDRYTTGFTKGEIYKYASRKLYYSQNSGKNFIITNDTIYGFIEVGASKDEIYIEAISTWPTLIVKIWFSNDNGKNLEENLIDSSMLGITLSENFPHITRGSETGELYYTSWNKPANYKIYRSTDYGKTFTLQYEQPDTCDFYYESYSFTAGRGPGEFYIFKGMPWFDGVNTKLQVYYSSDYAKTFTKYEHVFDKNWTSVNEQLVINNEQLILTNSPNPFKETTTINFITNLILKNPVIEIFNLNGQLIKTIPANDNKIYCSSENLKSGIYLYRLKSDNFISQTKLMNKQ